MSGALDKKVSDRIDKINVENPHDWFMRMKKWKKTVNESESLELYVINIILCKQITFESMEQRSHSFTTKMFTMYCTFPVSVALALFQGEYIILSHSTLQRRVLKRSMGTESGSELPVPAAAAVEEDSDEAEPSFPSPTVSRNFPVFASSSLALASPSSPMEGLAGGDIGEIGSGLNSSLGFPGH